MKTMAGKCAAVMALAVFSATPVLAKDIRVTYAGSMGKVMEQGLGPVFAKAENVAWQGQGWPRLLRWPGCGQLASSAL